MPEQAHGTVGNGEQGGLGAFTRPWYHGGVTRILRVGHVVADTEAEGPGRRFAIWVQGCPMRCPGCCNPELLPFAGGTEWTTDALLERILTTPDIEGVTFLGGEPMSQPAAVLELARGIQSAGLTVMVFSGFTLAELRARKRADISELLQHIDLLVDGRYEREQPEENRRWIGSRNQVMHFQSERYTPTDARFSAPQTVEIRLSAEGLLVNGWPAAAAEIVRPAKPLRRDNADSGLSGRPSGKTIGNRNVR